MRALSVLGRIFPRNAEVDLVATTARFDATPDAVWRAMIFYEEVRQRPSLLLRTFLPAPVRTQGEKTRVGALIECTYDGGYLEKQIVSAEPGRFVSFDVLVQRLGIEDVISMSGGSYTIHTNEGRGGSDVVLTTRYRGHLRPRWLWRPFERFLAHRLHRHILEGMRVALHEGAAAVAELAPVSDASSVLAREGRAQSL